MNYPNLEMYLLDLKLFVSYKYRITLLFVTNSIFCSQLLRIRERRQRKNRFVQTVRKVDHVVKWRILKMFFKIIKIDWFLESKINHLSHWNNAFSAIFHRHRSIRFIINKNIYNSLIPLEHVIRRVRQTIIHVVLTPIKRYLKIDYVSLQKLLSNLIS